MKKLSHILGSFVGIFVPIGSALAVGSIDFGGVFQNFYQCGQYGGNNQYSANTVLTILENIGGFLIIAGSILAGIVIITSGILYMVSGSNQQRVGMAKGVFKNGIIGSLILFAAGIIVNTIILLVSDPLNFFWS